MTSIAEMVSINGVDKKQHRYSDKIGINIFSNINVNFIEEPLKVQILKNLLNPSINFFDIKEMMETKSIGKNKEFSIVFWELYNILNVPTNKIKLIKKKELKKIIFNIKNEIEFFLQKIIHNKIIIFNLFTNIYFKKNELLFNKTKIIVGELNKFLRNIAKKNKNLHLLNLDNNNFEKDYDLKSFNKTKSIYNLNFFFNYSKLVSPLISSICGKVKKVLIVDCDNTLWNGIVGEGKVQFSKSNKVGKYYYEAQKKIKFLSKNGAIICLCSKNNQTDVDKIIKSNSSELIKNSDITVKKINWENKVKNILEISKELNLDFSSFIFLDDSEFELDLIRKYLPQILCVQVPKNIKNLLKQKNLKKILAILMDTLKV